MNSTTTKTNWICTLLPLKTCYRCQSVWMCVSLSRSTCAMVYYHSWSIVEHFSTQLTPIIIKSTINETRIAVNWALCYNLHWIFEWRRRRQSSNSDEHAINWAKRHCGNKWILSNPLKVHVTKPKKKKKLDLELKLELEHKPGSANSHLFHIQITQIAHKQTLTTNFEILQWEHQHLLTSRARASQYKNMQISHIKRQVAQKLAILATRRHRLTNWN